MQSAPVDSIAVDNTVYTNRELSEVRFAMLYARDFGHGTDGHNRLLLIAKMATALGFTVNSDGGLNHPTWEGKG